MVNKLNNTAEYLTIILLDATELSTHLILTCPISAINFFLILRTSILHPNLKFILLSQSTCIFTRSAGRLIIAAGKVFTGDVLWGGTEALKLIFGFSAFFRNFLAHVLVVERLIATLWVKNYENSRGPWFSIGWFIILTILAFANTFQLVSSTAVKLFTWSIVFILALLETLIFLWIWRHNGRNFHEKLFAGHHSLSERYQIAENIRTGRQLVPTLFIHFFNISLGTLVNWCEYALIFGPVQPNLFNYALLEQLFYCTIAATSFLIELTMIIYHPYIHRNFMAILHGIMSKFFCQSRIRPSAKCEEIEKQQIVRMNIFGEKVDFGSNGGSESDEYFFQLKRTWEICDKRKS